MTMWNEARPPRPPDHTRATSRLGSAGRRRTTRRAGRVAAAWRQRGGDVSLVNDCAVHCWRRSRARRPDARTRRAGPSRKMAGYGPALAVVVPIGLVVLVR